MKRRLSALLCALTLALSLSGCWSGDVSDDSSGDFWEETPPVEADTSSTLTPITSFALPYLQGVTLDPITCPDGMQQTLGALLYEGLFVLDESFAPQNVLCSRYEHNDDCTSYTFYLRDGVSFSDGSSLTASDVLATLRRAQESERYSARRSPTRRFAAPSRVRSTARPSRRATSLVTPRRRASRSRRTPASIRRRWRRHSLRLTSPLR